MKESKVSGSFVRLCGKNVGFSEVMKSPPIKLTVNSRFRFEFRGVCFSGCPTNILSVPGSST